jgi:hypothetical protein
MKNQGDDDSWQTEQVKFPALHNTQPNGFIPINQCCLHIHNYTKKIPKDQLLILVGFSAV